MPDHVDHAFKIDVHEFGEFPGADFLEPCTGVDDAGVAQDRSGTPCEFMTTLAQVLDRVGIRFVDGIELVRAPDGRAEFFNCPRGAAAACDLLPQRRKLIHHRPAQAARNAGD